MQVYVDRLGSNIQVVRRNSNSCRRIVLHGSDGSLRTFLIQGSQVCGDAPCGLGPWLGSCIAPKAACLPSSLAMQTTTGSEERIQALLRNANTRLLAHPEARRRLLQLKTPLALVPYQGTPRGRASLQRPGPCPPPPPPEVTPRQVFCSTRKPPRVRATRLLLLPQAAGVRMVEDDVSIVPFSEAYETHCARYGREADAPILAFKDRCCTTEGMTTDVNVRLQGFQDAVEKGVTENIFSQFMYKTMVENNLSMWIIKKQFALSAATSGEAAHDVHAQPRTASDVAEAGRGWHHTHTHHPSLPVASLLAAVACHMVLLTGRSPSKLLVSRSMGTITHADLISTYDTRFQLERGHETVPFRLTRNMQSFIGPQGMEGMVVCAITAAAQALQTEPSIASSIVALFFRYAGPRDCLVGRGGSWPTVAPERHACCPTAAAGTTSCPGQRGAAARVASLR